MLPKAMQIAKATIAIDKHRFFILRESSVFKTLSFLFIGKTISFLNRIVSINRHLLSISISTHRYSIQDNVFGLRYRSSQYTNTASSLYPCQKHYLKHYSNRFLGNCRRIRRRKDNCVADNVYRSVCMALKIQICKKRVAPLFTFVCPLCFSGLVGRSQGFGGPIMPESQIEGGPVVIPLLDKGPDLGLTG